VLHAFAAGVGVSELEGLEPVDVDSSCERVLGTADVFGL